MLISVPMVCDRGENSSFVWICCLWEWGAQSILLCL